MAQRYHHKLEPQAAPAFFVRGPSPFARLVFFSILSLTLMAADAKLHYLNAFRMQLVSLMHPLQVLANVPAATYQEINTFFSTHRFLLKESKALQARVLNQSIALQQLNTLKLENSHLRMLLNATQISPQHIIMGEVMHVGRDPFTKKIMINRGEQHQVQAGEAVVDAIGVIGQVTRVYSSTSEVTLVTDKSLSIPVQIERNGLRAVALGHGRDSTLDLPYLPTNVDIKRGDKLVTSGIDGVYPAGLSVATVIDIEITRDSPFARIVCKPTGGVDHHKQVLVVSMPDVSNAVSLSQNPKNTKLTHIKSTSTTRGNGQMHTPASKKLTPNEVSRASQ
jgi:rod shape-determining protein MreC